MKTEKELFLEWLYDNTSYDHVYIRGEREEDEVFHNDIIQSLWQAWQASANRDGYKLVPVEPTDEMINTYRDKSIAPISALSVIGYKAMINAI